MTSCRNTDLALIHDAVESALIARDNPHDPRVANAPTIHLLSRQTDTTMVQTVRTHFHGIRESNARPTRSIRTADQVQQSIALERVDETI